MTTTKSGFLSRVLFNRGSHVFINREGPTKVVLPYFFLEFGCWLIRVWLLYNMNLTLKHIKTITGFDFGSAVKVAHPVGHLCKRTWIQIAVQKCGSDGPSGSCFWTQNGCCIVLLSYQNWGSAGRYPSDSISLSACWFSFPTSIPLGSEGGAGEIVWPADTGNQVTRFKVCWTKRDRWSCRQSYSSSWHEDNCTNAITHGSTCIYELHIFTSSCEWYTVIMWFD